MELKTSAFVSFEKISSGAKSLQHIFSALLTPRLWAGLPPAAGVLDPMVYTCGLEELPSADHSQVISPGDGWETRPSSKISQ